MTVARVTTTEPDFFNTLRIIERLRKALDAQHNAGRQIQTGPDQIAAELEGVVARHYAMPLKIFDPVHQTYTLGNGFSPITVFTTKVEVREWILADAVRSVMNAWPYMPIEDLSALLVNRKHVFTYSLNDELQELISAAESSGIHTDPSIFFLVQKKEGPVMAIRVFKGKAATKCELSHRHPFTSNCRIGMFNFAP